MKENEQQEKDGLELGETVFPGGSVVKNPATNAGGAGSVLESRRSPGGGTAAHASILTWEIPRTEEPHWLLSVGPQKRWTRVSN